MKPFHPLPVILAATLMNALTALPMIAADPYPGYTLFSTGRTAYLYNMDKEKVHEWSVSQGVVKTSPYLLTNGSVLFPLRTGEFPFRPGGAHGSGTFQRIGWDGELLWDFQFFGEDFTPSYDLEPMPNGNVLLCAGYQDPRMPGKLFEIQPVGKTGGKVVWECNVTEILGGGVFGYINSVSYNASLDRILINTQQPGQTLAVIDHGNADAKLLFTWNKGFAERLHGSSWVNDTYVGTSIKIPDADPEKMRVGNLLVVSNNDNAVVEIDPRNNREVKRIPYQFSGHQGSAQRLPNGNTLIVSGYSKRIDEVDDEGNVVWSLDTPGEIARALRYGMEFPGVSRLKED